jgi:hypothetical protein
LVQLPGVCMVQPMFIKRRDIGLHLVTDGRQRGISWVELEARAIAASLKPKPSNPGNVDNMRRDPANISPDNMPDEKRCAFRWSKGDRKGKRCGRWAMKGATRCPCHGGYRQNPEHPATVRRIADIQHQHEAMKAHQKVRAIAPARINEISLTLRQWGLPLSPGNILDGSNALDIDDNGRAYRRWIEQVKETSIKQGPRAKKPKLVEQRKAAQMRKI